MKDCDSSERSQEAALQHLRDNTIASTSRSVYRQAQCKFLSYCFSNHPNVPNPTFRAKLGVPPMSFKALTARIRDNLTREELPVKFEEISSDFFASFLISLRKKDGEKPGLATFLTHRSTLVDLFRTYRAKMPKEM